MAAQPLLGFEPRYLFFATQPAIQLHLIPLDVINNNFIRNLE